MRLPKPVGELLTGYLALAVAAIVVAVALQSGRVTGELIAAAVGLLVLAVALALLSARARGDAFAGLLRALERLARIALPGWRWNNAGDLDSLVSELNAMTPRLRDRLEELTEDRDRAGQILDALDDGILLRGGAAAGHQPDRARLVRAAGGPPAGPAAAPGDRRGPDRRAGRGGHRQEGAGHGHDHGGPARAPDAGAAGLPARRPRPDRQDRGDAQRHHPAPPPGGAAARLRGQRLPRAEDAGGGAARAVGDPGERAAGRSRRRARLRHTHQPRGRTARRPGARPPRPVEAGARHAGRRARGHGRPRQGGRRDLFRARQRAPHPAPHGAAARIDGA